MRILILEPASYWQAWVASLDAVDLFLVDGIVLHQRRIKIQDCALAYCWGLPVLEKQINCDAADIAITLSLCGALNSVQQEHLLARVRANALYIDQHGAQERSMQVGNILSLCSKGLECCRLESATPSRLA